MSHGPISWGAWQAADGSSILVDNGEVRQMEEDTLTTHLAVLVATPEASKSKAAPLAVPVTAPKLSAIEEEAVQASTEEGPRRGGDDCHRGNQYLPHFGLLLWTSMLCV